MESPRIAHWPLVAGWSAALTGLILGPVLGPGYLLIRDAVSTPTSYLTDQALGLGGGAPRAVPQDAIIAVLSQVIDGGIVVKALAAGALIAAGMGAAALVARVLAGGLGPQLVASTVMLWNPFVAERLLQGHWSLLIGYAALPWAALVARHSWAGLALCLAVGGITPTGCVLVALIALAASPVRRWAGVLGLTLLAAAPWVITGLLAEPAAADPAAVGAFAARAEPGLGIVGTLAGLGGIWNIDAVPASRLSLAAVVGTAILLAVICAGVPQLWRERSVQPIAGLSLVSAGAIVAVAALATGPGQSALRNVTDHISALGLLRDSSKWIALCAPAYVLAAGAGCAAVAGLLSRIQLSRALAPGVLIVPLIAALPDLAWGVGGKLKPVEYPSDWARVSALVDGGDVAVLPGGMFRIFDFAGPNPVLDPAPRMLRAEVLQTGDLTVDGVTIRGENSRAAEVEKALLTGEPAAELRELGIEWVLVERGTPGPLGESVRTLRETEQIYRGDDLELYRVGGAATPDAETNRAAALFAHALWLLALVGGLIALGWQRLRSARRRSPTAVRP